MHQCSGFLLPSQVRVQCCWRGVQARAKAAEEALAAAKAAAEEERLVLQGQADESRTVVGQWKEAYEKLTSQYEEMQVGFLHLLSCHPHTRHAAFYVILESAAMSTMA